jgi:hypothetical protein
LVEIDDAVVFDLVTCVLGLVFVLGIEVVGLLVRVVFFIYSNGSNVK